MTSDHLEQLQYHLINTIQKGYYAAEDFLISNSLFNDIQNDYESSDSTQKIKITHSIENLESAVEEHILKIYLLSFLCKITLDNVYIEKILDICLNSKTLNMIQKNFIRWQCMCLCFNYENLGNYRISLLQRKIYREVFHWLFSSFKDIAKPIPKK